MEEASNALNNGSSLDDYNLLRRKLICALNELDDVAEAHEAI